MNEYRRYVQYLEAKRTPKTIDQNTINNISIEYILVNALVTAIYFISNNFTYDIDVLALGDDTRKLIAVLLVSLMLGTIATSMAATDVTVSGSTTVGPLADLCADAFNAAHTDYHVTVSQTGTGPGIASLIKGQVQIAMASRDVSKDEMNSSGNKIVQTPVGYDGVAIILSKSIYDGGVTALTKDQVKKIYAGDIKNWKELGGPDKAILAINREEGSGTRDNFLTDIMGSAKAFTNGSTNTQNGNSAVKTLVGQSDNAIGYVGYSFSQSGNIGVVTLDGIKLIETTVKDKTYPLSRKLYLDTIGEPTNGAKAFIDFVAGSDGQKIAKDNGFIAL